MIIYWSMLAFTGLLAILQRGENNRISFDGAEENKKLSWFFVTLFGAYLVFWIGLRSGISDTNAYIHNYEHIPLGFDNLGSYLDSVIKGKGFYLYAFLFKNFFLTNYHAWLFSLTLIMVFCVLHVYYQKSENFAYTAFLFISSCSFTWLFNGIRQFLAVCILFCFSKWIEENKTIRYILITLIASSIHNTALIFIPIVIFLRKKDVWKRRTILIIIAFIGIVFFADDVLDIFTQTEIGGEYTDALNDSTGSNIFRVLIAMVPCVLSFIKRKIIEEEGNDFIKLCVNMSIFTVGFYSFATVTNGILVGRIPVYFELYNFILLPWLIKHGFKSKDQTVLNIVCVVLYVLYFYYQINLTWHLFYISDFTGWVS